MFRKALSLMLCLCMLITCMPAYSISLAEELLPEAAVEAVIEKTPAEEAPVEEEPVEEAPIEEEPVEEEPIEEEPVEEAPIEEAPIEEAPIEEELPVIEELPAVEESTEAGSEEATEEPAEEDAAAEDAAQETEEQPAVLPGEGYASIKAARKLYADASLETVLGVLVNEAVVYICGRMETGDQDEDVLTVLLSADGEVLTAYIRAKHASIMTEEETAVYLASASGVMHDGICLAPAYFETVEEEPAAPEATEEPAEQPGETETPTDETTGDTADEDTPEITDEPENTEEVIPETEEELLPEIDEEPVIGEGEVTYYDAASGTWGDHTWTLSGTTLTISGSGALASAYSGSYPWSTYEGQVTKLVIGNYVTSIPQYAFEDFAVLTTLTLGTGLTTIGNYAFDGCANLPSVTIPKSVTAINKYAFNNCSNLSSVSFASGSKLASIGNYAFYGCSNIIALSFPDALTTIGESSFLNCTNLISVTFGSKINSIGYNAFNNCDALSALDFPSSLRTINNYAFYDCDNLLSVVLPYGLETIGSYAFCNCEKLTGTVKIPGSVTSWGNYSFQNTGVTTANIYAACKIPKYAFYNCTSLATLVISGNVTGVGEGAFEYNTSLKKVNLPATVTSVGYRAFSDCTALATLTCSTGLVSIDGYAFHNTPITSLKLPSTVTSLGTYCFSNCTALKTVTLSSGLTSIPNNAFLDCTALTTVTLGNNINSIGNAAFYNCSALSSINWPTNLNSIGQNAFYNCDGLVSITFPSALNTIKYGAFRYCDNLKSVTLAQNVNTIEGYAFANCPKLTSFKNYSANTTYNNYTFSSSTGVTLYGFSGSTTETHASDRGLAFSPITTLETPTNKKIQNVVTGIRLYWNYVPGATYYSVWRSTSSSGSYSKVADYVAPLLYVDTTVSSGTTYYYKVKAHNAQASSGYSAVQSQTYVGTPDITSRTNKAAGISIGWNKIAGATGYAVYRKPYSGDYAWQRVATISGGSTLTWTDTSVKSENGTIYKYTVRGLYGSVLSGSRPAGRTMVRLQSLTLKSVAKSGTTSIKCTWTSTTAADGYQVRFMADGVATKTFKVTSNSISSKAFGGLTAGKNYKIQVRSFKKVDGVGTFNSAWSSALYLDL